jgi:hypothetical protein
MVWIGIERGVCMSEFDLIRANMHFILHYTFSKISLFGVATMDGLSWLSIGIRFNVKVCIRTVQL